MAYETITVGEDGGIATITLNRPERLNAYTPLMGDELIHEMKRLDGEEDVRVVIITGAGRAFCSGADMKDTFEMRVEAKEKGEVQKVALGNLMEKLPMAFHHLTKPSIAMVNGPAIGGGYSIALACDIRIASEDATLGGIFVRFGQVPECGSSYILPRLVGIAKACELIFAAKTVSGREAKEIGLVNQVVPASELKSATYEMARTIAQMAPLAISLAKRSLYQGLDSDFATQVQTEYFGVDFCYGTRDHKEAAKAFLEKRRPVFEGR